MPDVEPQSLKAILFADLAQYSKLTAASELATLELVSRCFETFKEHCPPYQGEFIKTMGDGVLVVFNGVSNAITYAMTAQQKLAELSGKFPAAARFRIGLHIGEVRSRDGDVFGHAVNVAARVQTRAEPGGVCATIDVVRAARNTTPYGFRFAGRHALKNISEMVSLYQVTPPGSARMDMTIDRLSVAVIDGLAIQGADGRPLVIRSRKAQALIGYLVLSSGYRELQSRVAILLWPDRPAAEARAALDNCMRIVGKSFNVDSAESELRRGNYVSIDPAGVIVDLSRILDDLNEGRIDDSLLHRSDWADGILRGFEGVSDLYRAWLSVTRHNQRERTQEALEELLARFDDSETVVKRAASALLLLEPSHEGAVRSLMRHHAAGHSIAAAMRVFGSFRDTMRERYNLEPGPETAALAANLSEPVASATHKKLARSRTPVIAVGAFAADSASIGAYVSGFRSQLVINLSKFRELTVIDLQDGTDGTNSDYVFKADCKAAGEEIWVFVLLEELGAQRVIWSDSYQLSFESWLQLQKQIVNRIASNLEVYLSHDRLARAMQRLPQDLGVYDAWLRGEHLLARWSAVAEDEAERLFEQAIAEDPSFAPSYASLASIYNSRHFIRPGSPRDPQTERRALELAGRAVELDPLDARNHMVVAWSAAMVKRFEMAELHYELASELNPNDPKIVVSAALGLAFMKRTDLATKLLQHAFSLTSLFPNYQWSHIATTRYLTGDYEGAVEAANRSQNLIIDTPGWKAAALLILGRIGDAQTAFMELQQSVSNAWDMPVSPSRNDVLAWFLGAFPFRGELERQTLAELFHRL